MPSPKKKPAKKALSAPTADAARRPRKAATRVRPAAPRTRAPAKGTTHTTRNAPMLAAALQAQAEGVVIADRTWSDGGLPVLFANTSFCAMTGYGEPELLRRGLGFLHVEKSDFVRLRRWQRFLEPGRTLTGEGYLTRKNGSALYAAWSFSPLADERGKVTHIVATYRDMTEKRRLQEALVHAQRLDAVGRLAGGVAHDFNNLLSVINGYCEILGSKPIIRDKASREIEEIHQASQKATALVRQLLAFSRRQAMDPKVISVNQLVRENADILTKLLRPDKSLALSLQAEPGHIRVDPAQLQQVILNLTLNARDALHEGGQVTISTGVRDIKPGRHRRLTDMPPGRYVTLAVTDNGIGMDDHTQSHLFEPFFTTKEHGKGTGLGLSLVYGVVQQSGGHILVHSAPNVGSTFEIYLPEVTEPAQALATTVPTLPSTNGRETVLIVESDDVVRKMVAGILTADGYRVLATSDEEQGLAEARKQTGPIDLLIADLAQPGSDGEKLTRALHLQHPRLRILATGTGEGRTLPWVAPGMQGCLMKPFALSSLLRATRSLLDGKGAPTDPGYFKPA